MKELKLDLLPGNLYAARRKAVKIEGVSLKVDRIDGDKR